MKDCPACGYPLKAVKVIPGSYRAKQKVKMKCSANDCAYEVTIAPSQERYMDMQEQNIRDEERINKFRQAIINGEYK